MRGWVYWAYVSACCRGSTHKVHCMRQSTGQALYATKDGYQQLTANPFIVQSHYTMAMKSQAGQSCRSRCWLRPGSASLFQSTRWFNAKHRLQDWTNGPGRVRVSEPKPFVYTSPTEIWVLLTRMERCVDLSQPGNHLDPYPPVGTSVVVLIHASNLMWGTRTHPAGGEALSCNPLNAHPSFLPIELYWPPPDYQSCFIRLLACITTGYRSHDLHASGDRYPKWTVDPFIV